jgi:hypothetical protein
LHSVGCLALVNSLVDGLRNLLVNDELGHGVRNPEILLSVSKLGNSPRSTTYCLNRMGPKPA